MRELAWTEPSQERRLFFVVGSLGTGAVSLFSVGGGPPSFPFDGQRRMVVSEFNALNNAWLRLSMNAATGDGGTCYGDSGAPNFLGAGTSETDIIAAITVTGDAVCRATSVVCRLDTATARDFLGQYLTLP